MKRLILGIAALFATASRAEPAVTFTPSTFVSAVLERHPEAAIESARAQLAEAATKGAGSLPDPMIMVGKDRVPFGKSQEEAHGDLDARDGMLMFGVSQTIPWPGALSAEKAASKARAVLARHKEKTFKEQLRLEALEIYVEILAMDELLRVERADLEEVRRIARFAEGRFEQGLGSHMEYLSTQNDLAIAEANVATLEAERENLVSLALLMVGRVGTRPSDVRFEAEGEEWTPKSLLGPDDGEDLRARELELEQEANLREADAEKRQTLPSFMLSGEVMQGDDMRTYSAAIGVNVPLFSGGRREAAAEKARLYASEAAARQAWHQSRKALALEQNARRIERLQAQLETVSDRLIPTAREHLRAALAEYGQGKSTIRSVNEARKMLLGLEESKVRVKRTLALAAIAGRRLALGLDESLPQGGIDLLPTSMMSGGAMDGMSENMPMMRNESRGESRRRPPSRPAPMRDDMPQNGGMRGMGM